MLQKAERHVIPLSSGGLPPDTVIIEDANLALYDIDGDGTEDISHDRQTGKTLILTSEPWPGLPRSTFLKGCIFYHRWTGQGVEVNAVLDLDRFTSASRSAITPAMEERAEVGHAVALIGYCGPLGSVASTTDFHAAGRL